MFGQVVNTSVSYSVGPRDQLSLLTFFRGFSQSLQVNSRTVPKN
jgi:hypothetical protein